MATDTTRRAVALGAALLPVTAVAALSATPDPIFAALAAEKEAETRWTDLGDWPTDTPEAWDAGFDAFLAEGDHYQATFRRTMATVPTTAAGLLAMLDRFEVTTDGVQIDPDVHGLTELLATVRAFVGGRT